MENKFINQTTDEARKNYAYQLLTPHIQLKHQTADNFFAQTPLTPADVNFYLEDDDADLRKRFTRLNRLTPDQQDNSLFAKHQRSFVQAANAAYQDPKENLNYMKNLDRTAEQLINIVDDVNNHNFDAIPNAVSDLNKHIKTTKIDRPISKSQNACNIAVALGYLAIAIAATALCFILPTLPIGIAIVLYTASVISGAGFAYMGGKSINGIRGVTGKKPGKLGFMSGNNRNPHTIFTPKPKALRHAKSISNIASRKAKIDNVAEKARSLKPFRSKYVEV